MENRILVIGDAMLDSYHFGDVKRISPEAPVPVFLEIGKKKYSPGGAANVAINIAAVGVQTDLMAVVGEDKYGQILIDSLCKYGINTDLLLMKQDYSTISKLRYIGPGNQQILRVDNEDTTPISDEIMLNLLKKLEGQIKEYRLIVISDYLKGLLTEKTTQSIIHIANNNNVPVLIDVKDKNINKYNGAKVLKPNRKELSEMTGLKTDDIEEATTAAVELCKKTNSGYVLATLGADGMILCNANGLVKQVKSQAVDVFDVTGAGDTSIAYLAAELVKDSDIVNAMIVANYAAGVQVSKVGTSIVYPEEVHAVMNEDGKDVSDAVLNLSDENGLAPIIRAKNNNKKIVFTNGCFDILHVGHISYLKQAKQLGDVLVIGVNSDESVRRLKGASRPINNAEDRMLLLSALDFVDYVVEFEEDTPAKLIEIIKPDVLVKGGDYKENEIVGADFVKDNGGIVKILPFVEGKSTTSIVEKMKKG